MIRFKADISASSYYLEGFFRKDGKWIECEVICDLCLDGVKVYLGDVDYVCFAEKPPAYAKSQAYKIQLESIRRWNGVTYYLRFLDTHKPRLEHVTKDLYFFLHRFFGKKPFYAWGEYAEEQICRFRVKDT